MTIPPKLTLRLAPLAAAVLVMIPGAVLAQETLGRVEQSPGGGSTRYISAADQEQLSLLRDQARAVLDDGDWAEAETLLRRLLALEWDELRAIDTLRSLAQVYEGQGRYPEAVTAYRSVLKQSEEAWGGEDGTPRIAERLDLGRALEGAGRSRDAERSYRQALRLSIQALDGYEPGHHSEVIDGPQVSTFAILQSLDRLLSGLGRAREMERLYREVLPLYVEAVGEDDRYTQAVRARLATLAA